MNDDALLKIIKAIDGGIELRLKVVPGASRSRIAGVLGDRLKVQVAAPPEAGKANKVVIDLLARALGAPARDITITAGQSQAMKTVHLHGVTAEQARQALGL